MWMMEPSPEFTSYDDVPTLRKTWVFMIAVLLFIPAAIAMAVTGPVYQKAKPKFRSQSEVWQMTNAGKWVTIVAFIVIVGVNIARLSGG